MKQQAPTVRCVYAQSDLRLPELLRQSLRSYIRRVFAEERTASGV